MKEEELKRVSNPLKVFENARRVYGGNTQIFISNRKDKKYMIYNPFNNKFVHFGQMGYEDYTKHGDQERRNNYLNRTSKIKGDWRNDKYSPNNLSRFLLWDA